MRLRAHARGFAAISAIVVAATVASVATCLLWQGNLAIRQTENIGAVRQADALVESAVAVAAASLTQDDPRVDHAGEAWMRALPILEVDGASVAGNMRDAQAKFNINNLVDGDSASDPDIIAFRRLLKHVGLPEALSDAVVDWLDADNSVTGLAGAEDAYYVALVPGYRAANRQIGEISELLLVKGFTAAHVRRLEPYVTALPGPTKVNINTVGAEVLAAMLPDVSLSGARKIVAARDKEAFGSKLEFATRLPESAVASANELLDTRSAYFLASGRVRSGRIDSGFRALLGRDGPVVISLAKDFG